MLTGLLEWFDAHARDLPWRAPDRTEWGVLVSEVMLQQTPVARVEPLWLAWLERWPTPADLAAATPADVLRAWHRLGYPSRALRLLEAARVITSRHDGQVPDDDAALRALPGVGPYTSAAVRAFAFGQRAAVLDTNVRRVLARALAGAALPPPTQRVAEQDLALSVLPPDGPTAARSSLALMELGALVCTSRAPACEECPLSGRCAWLAAGQPADEHTTRRLTQPWTGTDRQARGRILAALRAADGPVRLDDIDWPDRAQLDRCAASLARDALVVLTASSGAAPTAHLPLS